ncbi:hypothetical protein JCM10212_003972 [Sporobolomyces blumeae]
MGIRPATPGTIVVLAATVLLVLVSVSTPLLKSIYFLEADLSSGNYAGTVKLGAWGYCVGTECTSPKLGYSLNVAELLSINGKLSGVSNSVLKWITYLMILHPIAAAFGVVSVIFGLLAHMHNFAGTALTTCFASFAATFSLLAFVFDIAVFVIAKQRIDSSSVGGNASLGPAVWMTLAAMVLFGLSGCFFGCGACVIRKQRAGREASEKTRPMPDEEYGSKLRGDALAAHERDKAYLAANTRGEGVLPAFTEHDRNKEDIPLNSMAAVAFDDDNDYQPRAYPPPPSHPSTQRPNHNHTSSSAFGAPSLISGVGEGYGRRNNAIPGMPVSLSPESAYTPLPPPGRNGTPNNAGRGTGISSRLAADARAQRGYAPLNEYGDDRRQATGASAATTTEPFVGMYDRGNVSTSPPPMSDQNHYPPPVSSYDHASGQGHGGMAMPVPQTNEPRQQVSPAYGGSYPAYPPPQASSTPAALVPGGGGAGSSTNHGAYGSTPYGSTPYGSSGAEKMPYPSSASPPPVPQQSYHVQNPSPSSHAPDASLYSYAGAAHGHGTGTVDRVPSTHAPTYYTYEDAPYGARADPDSQRDQGYEHDPYGDNSVEYHPQGSGNAGGGGMPDPYGYDSNRRY